MHRAGVNQTPPVAKAIRVVPFHMKSLPGMVLEDGNRIVSPLHEQVDRFRAQQRRVEAVKEYWTAAALRMPDLPGEDGFLGGTAASVELEITVAEDLDHLGPQRFSGAAQRDIAGRIR